MLKINVGVKKLFRTFGNYTLFSILCAAIGFATVPYLTRALSPEEFGIIGIFQVVIYLTTPIISFQSTALVGINRVSLDAKDYHHFLAQYLSFGIILFCGMMIFSVACSIFKPAWVMLAVSVPFISFIRLLLGIKRTELVQDEKPNQFGMLTLTISILTLTLTVCLISFVHWSWEGRIAAVLCSEAVIVLFFIVIIDPSWRDLKFNLEKVFLQELFRYGLPLMIGVGAGWLINQADRLIVLKYFSLADVGVYTAAYMIGFSISLVNNAITNSMAPLIYKELNAGKGLKLVKRYNAYYSVVILALSLVLGVVAYFWAGTLLGDAYEGSGLIIAIVGVAFAFSGVYRTTGIVVGFYKLTVLKMKLLYTCAICNVLISISLIPKLGILAPAVGTLIAYILLALLMYHFAIKAMRDRGVCA